MLSGIASTRCCIRVAGAAMKAIVAPPSAWRGIRKSFDQPCASAFATTTVPLTRSPATVRVATNAVAEQTMP